MYVVPKAIPPHPMLASGPILKKERIRWDNVEDNQVTGEYNCNLFLREYPNTADQLYVRMFGFNTYSSTDVIRYFNARPHLFQIIKKQILHFVPNDHYLKGLEVEQFKQLKRLFVTSDTYPTITPDDLGIRQGPQLDNSFFQEELLKLVVGCLQDYLTKSLFPVEATMNCESLRYQPPMFRYFEFVPSELEESLPENIETESIPELISKIRYRSNLVWTRSELTLPIIYKYGKVIAGLDEYGHTTSFDIITISAGVRLRFISHWKSNNTIVAFYEDDRTDIPPDQLEPFTKSITNFPSSLSEGRSRSFFCFIPVHQCGIYFQDLTTDKINLHAIDDPKIIEPMFVISNLQVNACYGWDGGESIMSRNILGPSKRSLQKAILASGINLVLGEKHNLEVTDGLSHMMFMKNIKSSVFNNIEGKDSYYLMNHTTGESNQVLGITPVKDKTRGRPAKGDLVCPRLSYNLYLTLALEAYFDKTQLSDKLQNKFRKIKKIGNVFASSYLTGTDEWEDICSHIGSNYKLQQLRDIATNQFKAKPDFVATKSKRELCGFIAKLLEDRETRAMEKIKKIGRKSKERHQEKKEQYELPITVCQNWSEESSVHPDSAKFREMYGNEYFVLVKPDLSFHCYHINNLKFALENKMCKYKPRSPDTVVDDQGYGSIPDTSIHYYPFPLAGGFRGYLDEKSYREISERVLSAEEGNTVHYFYLKLVNNSVRMGNCEGIFGIGNVHGDALGEYVYKVDFARVKEVLPQPEEGEADRRVEDPEVRRELDGVNRLIGELTSRVQEIQPILDQIHERTVDIADPSAQIDESQLTPEERTIQSEWDMIQSQLRPLTMQRIRLTQRLYTPSSPQ